MIRSVRLGVLLAGAILAASCGGSPSGDADRAAVETERTPTSGTQQSDDGSSTTGSSTEVASPAEEIAPLADDWFIETFPGDDAAELPALIVAGPDGVRRIVDGVVEELDGFPGPVAVAFGDGRGRVVAELVDDRDGVATSVALAIRTREGTVRAIDVGPAETVDLHDVVVVDGSLYAIWARFLDPLTVDDDDAGHIVLTEVATGTETILTGAARTEFLVDRVSGSKAGLAISAFSDLTEVVFFVDYRGNERRQPSPTDDLEYNRPPLVIDAVLSDDGTELAVIEGPDVDGARDADEGGQLIGDWDVIVDDVEGEQMRLTVASKAIASVTIDFDGRWLVVSASAKSEWLEPIVIDTESVSLPAFRIEGVRGLARLDAAPQVPEGLIAVDRTGQNTAT